MKARRLLLAVAAVALVVAVGALMALRPWVGTAGPVTLRPDDAALTAIGERVYGQHCAACHGARLEGQPDWRQRGADGLMPAPPHDASGHTWHHADDVLFRITKHGVGKVANIDNYRTAMPVYEGVLTDEEIVAVLSWIKAQWPPEVRERHAQINEQYLQSR
jgi:mono/diheme cytochrome c family protein